MPKTGVKCKHCRCGLVDNPSLRSNKCYECGSHWEANANQRWKTHSCTRAISNTIAWHDALIHETWLIHICDMTWCYMKLDSFIHVTWLIHASEPIQIVSRGMMHWYVRHDAFIYETRFIVIWNTTPSYMWRDSFMHQSHLTYYLVAWLMHTWDMTDSYMRHESHESLLYEMWLIHTCDVAYSSARPISNTISWHNSCIRETWLIHIWDMNHYYTRRDSFIHVTWLIHAPEPSQILLRALPCPCCSILQSFAVCCSVMQYDAGAKFNVLQCVAVYCRLLQ